jgi:hypothetical protein
MQEEDKEKARLIEINLPLVSMVLLIFMFVLGVYPERR